MTPTDHAGGRPVVAAVRPEPDPAVLAAIVIAVEQCWPKPAAPAPTSSGQRSPTAWRFSGRWWARPTPLRRDRPSILR